MKELYVYVERGAFDPTSAYNVHSSMLNMPFPERASDWQELQRTLNHNYGPKYKLCYRSVTISSSQMNSSLEDFTSTSHYDKMISHETMVSFIHHTYNLVISVDLSPSLNVVDTSYHEKGVFNGVYLVDSILPCLRSFLRALCEPMELLGDSFLHTPNINVLIVAHGVPSTPLYTLCEWHLLQEEFFDELLSTISCNLEHALQIARAWLLKHGEEEVQNVHQNCGKFVRGECSSILCQVTSIEFILQNLSQSIQNAPNYLTAVNQIFLITDGVFTVKTAANQQLCNMRANNISLSIIQIGGGFSPSSPIGFVSDISTLTFISSFVSNGAFLYAEEIQEEYNRIVHQRSNYKYLFKENNFYGNAIQRCCLTKTSPIYPNPIQKILQNTERSVLYGFCDKSGLLMDTTYELRNVFQGPCENEQTLSTWEFNPTKLFQTEKFFPSHIKNNRKKKNYSERVSVEEEILPKHPYALENFNYFHYHNPPQIERLNRRMIAFFARFSRHLYSLLSLKNDEQGYLDTCRIIQILLSFVEHLRNSLETLVEENPHGQYLSYLQFYTFFFVENDELYLSTPTKLFSYLLEKAITIISSFEKLNNPSILNPSLFIPLQLCQTFLDPLIRNLPVFYLMHEYRVTSFYLSRANLSLDKLISNVVDQHFKMTKHYARLFQSPVTSPISPSTIDLPKPLFAILPEEVRHILSQPNPSFRPKEGKYRKWIILEFVRSETFNSNSLYRISIPIQDANDYEPSAFSTNSLSSDISSQPSSESDSEYQESYPLPSDPTLYSSLLEETAEAYFIIDVSCEVNYSLNSFVNIISEMNDDDRVEHDGPSAVDESDVTYLIASQIKGDVILLGERICTVIRNNIFFMNSQLSLHLDPKNSVLVFSLMVDFVISMTKRNDDYSNRLISSLPIQVLSYPQAATPCCCSQSRQCYKTNYCFCKLHRQMTQWRNQSAAGYRGEYVERVQNKCLDAMSYYCSNDRYYGLNYVVDTIISESAPLTTYDRLFPYATYYSGGQVMYCNEEVMEERSPGVEMHGSTVKESGDTPVQGMEREWGDRNDAAGESAGGIRGGGGRGWRESVEQDKDGGKNDEGGEVRGEGFRKDRERDWGRGEKNWREKERREGEKRNEDAIWSFSLPSYAEALEILSALSVSKRVLKNQQVYIIDVKLLLERSRERFPIYLLPLRQELTLPYVFVSIFPNLYGKFLTNCTLTLEMYSASHSLDTLCLLSQYLLRLCLKASTAFESHNHHLSRPNDSFSHRYDTSLPHIEGSIPPTDTSLPPNDSPSPVKGNNILPTGYSPRNLGYQFYNASSGFHDSFPRLYPYNHTGIDPPSPVHDTRKGKLLSFSSPNPPETMKEEGSEADSPDSSQPYSTTFYPKPRSNLYLTESAHHFSTKEYPVHIHNILSSHCLNMKNYMHRYTGDIIRCSYLHSPYNTQSDLRNTCVNYAINFTSRKLLHQFCFMWMQQKMQSGWCLEGISSSEVILSKGVVFSKEEESGEKEIHNLYLLRLTLDTHSDDLCERDKGKAMGEEEGYVSGNYRGKGTGLDHNKKDVYLVRVDMTMEIPLSDCVRVKVDEKVFEDDELRRIFTNLTTQDGTLTSVSKATSDPTGAYYVPPSNLSPRSKQLRGNSLFEDLIAQSLFSKGFPLTTEGVEKLKSLLFSVTSSLKGQSRQENDAGGWETEGRRKADSLMLNEEGRKTHDALSREDGGGRTEEGDRERGGKGEQYSKLTVEVRERKRYIDESNVRSSKEATDAGGKEKYTYDRSGEGYINVTQDVISSLLEVDVEKFTSLLILMNATNNFQNAMKAQEVDSIPSPDSNTPRKGLSEIKIPTTRWRDHFYLSPTLHFIYSCNTHFLADRSLAESIALGLDLSASPHVHCLPSNITKRRFEHDERFYVYHLDLQFARHKDHHTAYLSHYSTRFPDRWITHITQFANTLLHQGDNGYQENDLLLSLCQVLSGYSHKVLSYRPTTPVLPSLLPLSSSTLSPKDYVETAILKRFHGLMDIWDSDSEEPKDSHPHDTDKIGSVVIIGARGEQDLHWEEKTGDKKTTLSARRQEAFSSKKQVLTLLKMNYLLQLMSVNEATAREAEQSVYIDEGTREVEILRNYLTKTDSKERKVQMYDIGSSVTFKFPMEGRRSFLLKYQASTKKTVESSITNKCEVLVLLMTSYVCAMYDLYKREGFPKHWKCYWDDWNVRTLIDNLLLERSGGNWKTASKFPVKGNLIGVGGYYYNSVSNVLWRVYHELKCDTNGTLQRYLINKSFSLLIYSSKHWLSLTRTRKQLELFKEEVLLKDKFIGVSLRSTPLPSSPIINRLRQREEFERRLSEKRVEDEKGEWKEGEGKCWRRENKEGETSLTRQYVALILKSVTDEIFRFIMTNFSLALHPDCHERKQIEYYFLKTIVQQEDRYDDKYFSYFTSYYPDYSFDNAFIVCRLSVTQASDDNVQYPELLNISLSYVGNNENYNTDFNSSFYLTALRKIQREWTSKYTMHMNYLIINVMVYNMEHQIRNDVFDLDEVLTSHSKQFIKEEKIPLDCLFSTIQYIFINLKSFDWTKFQQDEKMQKLMYTLDERLYNYLSLRNIYPLIEEKEEGHFHLYFYFCHRRSARDRFAFSPYFIYDIQVMESSNGGLNIAPYNNAATPYPSGNFDTSNHSNNAINLHYNESAKRISLLYTLLMKKKNQHLNIQVKEYFLSTQHSHLSTSKHSVLSYLIETLHYIVDAIEQEVLLLFTTYQLTNETWDEVIVPYTGQSVSFLNNQSIKRIHKRKNILHDNYIVSMDMLVNKRCTSSDASFVSLLVKTISDYGFTEEGSSNGVVTLILSDMDTFYQQYGHLCYLKYTTQGSMCFIHRYWMLSYLLFKEIYNFFSLKIDLRLGASKEDKISISLRKTLLYSNILHQKHAEYFEQKDKNNRTRAKASALLINKPRSKLENKEGQRRSERRKIARKAEWIGEEKREEIEIDQMWREQVGEVEDEIGRYYHSRVQEYLSDESTCLNRIKKKWSPLKIRDNTIWKRKIKQRHERDGGSHTDCDAVQKYFLWSDTFDNYDNILPRITEEYQQSLKIRETVESVVYTRVSDTSSPDYISLTSPVPNCSSPLRCALNPWIKAYQLISSFPEDSLSPVKKTPYDSMRMEKDDILSKVRSILTTSTYEGEIIFNPRSFGLFKEDKDNYSGETDEFSSFLHDMNLLNMVGEIIDSSMLSALQGYYLSESCKNEEINPILLPKLPLHEVPLVASSPTAPSPSGLLLTGSASHITPPGYPGALQSLPGPYITAPGFLTANSSPAGTPITAPSPTSALVNLPSGHSPGITFNSVSGIASGAAMGGLTASNVAMTLGTAPNVATAVMSILDVKPYDVIERQRASLDVKKEKYFNAPLHLDPSFDILYFDECTRPLFPDPGETVHATSLFYNADSNFQITLRMLRNSFLSRSNRIGHALLPPLAISPPTPNTALGPSTDASTETRKMSKPLARFGIKSRNLLRLTEAPTTEVAGHIRGGLNSPYPRTVGDNAQQQRKEAQTLDTTSTADNVNNHLPLTLVAWVEVPIPEILLKTKLISWMFSESSEPSVLLPSSKTKDMNLRAQPAHPSLRRDGIVSGTHGRDLGLGGLLNSRDMTSPALSHGHWRDPQLKIRESIQRDQRRELMVNPRGKRDHLTASIRRDHVTLQSQRREPRSLMRSFAISRDLFLMHTVYVPSSNTDWDHKFLMSLSYSSPLVFTTRNVTETERAKGSVYQCGNLHYLQQKSQLMELSNENYDYPHDSVFISQKLKWSFSQEKKIEGTYLCDYYADSSSTDTVSICIRQKHPYLLDPSTTPLSPLSHLSPVSHVSNMSPASSLFPKLSALPLPFPKKNVILIEKAKESSKVNLRIAVYSNQSPEIEQLISLYNQIKNDFHQLCLHQILKHEYSIMRFMPKEEIIFLNNYSKTFLSNDISHQNLFSRKSSIETSRRDYQRSHNIPSSRRSITHGTSSLLHEASKREADLILREINGLRHEDERARREDEREKLKRHEERMLHEERRRRRDIERLNDEEERKRIEETQEGLPHSIKQDQAPSHQLRHEQVRKLSFNITCASLRYAKQFISLYHKNLSCFIQHIETTPERKNIQLTSIDSVDGNESMDAAFHVPTNTPVKQNKSDQEEVLYQHQFMYYSKAVSERLLEYLDRSDAAPSVEDETEPKMEEDFRSYHRRVLYQGMNTQDDNFSLLQVKFSKENAQRPLASSLAAHPSSAANSPYAPQGGGVQSHPLAYGGISANPNQYGGGFTYGFGGIPSYSQVYGGIQAYPTAQSFPHSQTYLQGYGLQSAAHGYGGAPLHASQIYGGMQSTATGYGKSINPLPLHGTQAAGLLTQSHQIGKAGSLSNSQQLPHNPPQIEPQAQFSTPDTTALKQNPLSLLEKNLEQSIYSCPPSLSVPRNPVLNISHSSSRSSKGLNYCETAEGNPKDPGLRHSLSEYMNDHTNQSNSDHYYDDINNESVYNINLDGFTRQSFRKGTSDHAHSLSQQQSESLEMCLRIEYLLLEKRKKNELLDALLVEVFFFTVQQWRWNIHSKCQERGTTNSVDNVLLDYFKEFSANSHKDELLIGSLLQFHHNYGVSRKGQVYSSSLSYEGFVWMCLDVMEKINHYLTDCTRSYIDLYLKNASTSDLRLLQRVVCWFRGCCRRVYEKNQAASYTSLGTVHSSLGTVGSTLGGVGGGFSGMGGAFSGGGAFQWKDKKMLRTFTDKTGYGDEYLFDGAGGGSCWDERVSPSFDKKGSFYYDWRMSDYLVNNGSRYYGDDGFNWEEKGLFYGEQDRGSFTREERGGSEIFKTCPPSLDRDLGILKSGDKKSFIGEDDKRLGSGLLDSRIPRGLSEEERLSMRMPLEEKRLWNVQFPASLKATLNEPISAPHPAPYEGPRSSLFTSNSINEGFSGFLPSSSGRIGGVVSAEGCVSGGGRNTGSSGGGGVTGRTNDSGGTFDLNEIRYFLSIALHLSVSCFVQEQKISTQKDMFSQIFSALSKNYTSTPKFEFHISIQHLQFESLLQNLTSIQFHLFSPLTVDSSSPPQSPPAPQTVSFPSGPSPPQVHLSQSNAFLPSTVPQNLPTSGSASPDLSSIFDILMNELCQPFTEMSTPPAEPARKTTSDTIFDTTSLDLDLHHLSFYGEIRRERFCLFDIYSTQKHLLHIEKVHEYISAMYSFYHLKNELVRHFDKSQPISASSKESGEAFPMKGYVPCHSREATTAPGRESAMLFARTTVGFVRKEPGEQKSTESNIPHDNEHSITVRSTLSNPTPELGVTSSENATPTSTIAMPINQYTNPTNLLNDANSSCVNTLGTSLPVIPSIIDPSRKSSCPPQLISPEEAKEASAFTSLLEKNRPVFYLYYLLMTAKDTPIKKRLLEGHRQIVDTSIRYHCFLANHSSNGCVKAETLFLSFNELMLHHSLFKVDCINPFDFPLRLLGVPYPYHLLISVLHYPIEIKNFDSLSLEYGMGQEMDFFNDKFHHFLRSFTLRSIDLTSLGRGATVQNYQFIAMNGLSEIFVDALALLNISGKEVGGRSISEDLCVSAQGKENALGTTESIKTREIPKTHLGINEGSVGEKRRPGESVEGGGEGSDQSSGFKTARKESADPVVLVRRKATGEGLDMSSIEKKRTAGDGEPTEQEKRRIGGEGSDASANEKRKGMDSIFSMGLWKYQEAKQDESVNKINRDLINKSCFITDRFLSVQVNLRDILFNGEIIFQYNLYKSLFTRYRHWRHDTNSVLPYLSSIWAFLQRHAFSQPKAGLVLSREEIAVYNSERTPSSTLWREEERGKREQEGSNMSASLDVAFGESAGGESRRQQVDWRESKESKGENDVLSLRIPNYQQTDTILSLDHQFQHYQSRPLIDHWKHSSLEPTYGRQRPDHMQIYDLSSPVSFEASSNDIELYFQQEQQNEKMKLSLSPGTFSPSTGRESRPHKTSAFFPKYLQERESLLKQLCQPQKEEEACLTFDSIFYYTLLLRSAYESSVLIKYSYEHNSEIKLEWGAGRKGNSDSSSPPMHSPSILNNSLASFKLFSAQKDAVKEACGILFNNYIQENVVKLMTKILSYSFMNPVTVIPRSYFSSENERVPLLFLKSSFPSTSILASSFTDHTLPSTPYPCSSDIAVPSSSPPLSSQPCSGTTSLTSPLIFFDKPFPSRVCSKEPSHAPTSASILPSLHLIDPSPSTHPLVPLSTYTSCCMPVESTSALLKDTNLYPSEIALWKQALHTSADTMKFSLMRIGIETKEIKIQYYGTSNSNEIIHIAKQIKQIIQRAYHYSLFKYLTYAYNEYMLDMFYSSVNISSFIRRTPIENNTLLSYFFSSIHSLNRKISYTIHSSNWTFEMPRNELLLLCNYYAQKPHYNFHHALTSSWITNDDDLHNLIGIIFDDSPTLVNNTAVGVRGDGGGSGEVSEGTGVRMRRGGWSAMERREFDWNTLGSSSCRLERMEGGDRTYLSRSLGSSSSLCSEMKSPALSKDSDIVLSLSFFNKHCLRLDGEGIFDQDLPVKGKEKEQWALSHARTISEVVIPSLEVLPLRQKNRAPSGVSAASDSAIIRRPPFIETSRPYAFAHLSPTPSSKAQSSPESSLVALPSPQASSSTPHTAQTSLDSPSSLQPLEALEKEKSGEDTSEERPVREKTPPASVSKSHQGERKEWSETTERNAFLRQNYQVRFSDDDLIWNDRNLRSKNQLLYHDNTYNDHLLSQLHKKKTVASMWTHSNDNTLEKKEDEERSVMQSYSYTSTVKEYLSIVRTTSRIIGWTEKAFSNKETQMNHYQMILFYPSFVDAMSNMIDLALGNGLVSLYSGWDSFGEQKKPERKKDIPEERIPRSRVRVEGGERSKAETEGGEKRKEENSSEERAEEVRESGAVRAKTKEEEESLKGGSVEEKQRREVRGKGRKPSKYFKTENQTNFFRSMYDKYYNQSTAASLKPTSFLDSSPIYLLLFRVMEDREGSHQYSLHLQNIILEGSNDFLSPHSSQEAPKPQREEMKHTHVVMLLLYISHLIFLRKRYQSHIIRYIKSIQVDIIAFYIKRLAYCSWDLMENPTFSSLIVYARRVVRGLKKLHLRNTYVHHNKVYFRLFGDRGDLYVLALFNRSLERGEPLLKGGENGALWMKKMLLRRYYWGGGVEIGGECPGDIGLNPGDYDMLVMMLEEENVRGVNYSLKALRFISSNPTPEFVLEGEKALMGEEEKGEEKEDREEEGKGKLEGRGRIGEELRRILKIGEESSLSEWWKIVREMMYLKAQYHKEYSCSRGSTRARRGLLNGRLNPLHSPQKEGRAAGETEEERRGEERREEERRGEETSSREERRGEGTSRREERRGEEPEGKEKRGEAPEGEEGQGEIVSMKRPRTRMFSLIIFLYCERMFEKQEREVTSSLFQNKRKIFPYYLPSIQNEVYQWIKQYGIDMWLELLERKLHCCPSFYQFLIKNYSILQPHWYGMVDRSGYYGGKRRRKKGGHVAKVVPGGGSGKKLVRKKTAVNESIHDLLGTLVRQQLVFLTSPILSS